MAGLAGLLGGYGSDDDEEEASDQPKGDQHMLAQTCMAAGTQQQCTTALFSMRQENHTSTPFLCSQQQLTVDVTCWFTSCPWQQYLRHHCLCSGGQHGAFVRQHMHVGSTTSQPGASDAAIALLGCLKILFLLTIAIVCLGHIFHSLGNHLH
jgi:hypothetical protein